jgi:hypothetical protein
MRRLAFVGGAIVAFAGGAACTLLEGLPDLPPVTNDAGSTTRDAGKESHSGSGGVAMLGSGSASAIGSGPASDAAVVCTSVTECMGDNPSQACCIDPTLSIIRGVCTSELECNAGLGAVLCSSDAECVRGVCQLERCGKATAKVCANTRACVALDADVGSGTGSMVGSGVGIGSGTGTHAGSGSGSCEMTCDAGKVCDTTTGTCCAPRNCETILAGIGSGCVSYPNDCGGEIQCRCSEGVTCISCLGAGSGTAGP